MPELTDLERAYKALWQKQASYDEKWSYYDGNAPMVYSTKKLKEIFGNIDARWRENWCAVVIDSVFERLTLARFSIDDTTQQERLSSLWTSTEMNLDSDDAHLAALVCGESFVIVWKDEDENVEAYYNDPRGCWIYYDPARPKVKKYAAKWFVGADGFRYISLYYDDRLEHYRSKKLSKDLKEQGGNPANWERDPDFPEDEPNNTGTIPVFHFRRERRAIKSELLNAIEIQNAVNKLFADMMIGSEFATIRQRYIVANLEGENSSINLDAKIAIIPAGDKESEPTQVGEFETAEIEKVTKAMDKLVGDLATITRTPHHYFEKQSGTPSGEALIAMEAPLVKKCRNYIERFIAEWKKVAAFVLELDGIEVKPEAIEPVFDNPETVQPRTRAEIRQISTSAGMPLETVLKTEEGWTDQQITDMQKAQATEQKAQADLFAAKAGAAGSLIDRGRD